MAQTTNSVLARKQILVLEDEYLLADDLRRALEDEGATVVGPFSTIAEAGAAADERRVDCAVLDLNVRGEFSFELSQRLRDRGVPIVFVSGYDGDMIPDELQAVPRFLKPVDTRALLGRIGDLTHAA